MSIYTTSTYPTAVNVQGTSGAGFRNDGTASVVMKPGDLVKKVTAVGNDDEGLFTAADLGTLPIRILDVKDLGVAELQDWSTFGTLQSYAIGDEVRTHDPDTKPGREWAGNVHNPGPGDLNLVEGDLLTVSAAVAGKFAKQAAPITATTLAQVTEAATIVDGTDGLVKFKWLGQQVTT